MRRKQISLKRFRTDAHCVCSLSTLDKGSLNGEGGQIPLSKPNVFYFSGAVCTRCTELVPECWHKMVLCSHLKYSIQCNCVHRHFTSPWQTPFRNLRLTNFAESAKQLITPKLKKKRKKSWYTHCQWLRLPVGFGGYLLSARKQGLDLVLGHWCRPLIRAWVLKEKIPTCVHTSAQRAPYSINVHGHQVWTLPQCPFWGPVHRISPPNNTKVSQ